MDRHVNAVKRLSGTVGGPAPSVRAECSQVARTERIVSYLTDALVDLGQDVTLVASGDSKTTAYLEPAWPRALRLDPTNASGR